MNKNKLLDLLAKLIIASVPCRYASVARGATAVNANERKNMMRQYYQATMRKDQNTMKSVY